MIAIDNCVAVDLLGQPSSGFYEKRPISSTGGYFQFVTSVLSPRVAAACIAMTCEEQARHPGIVPFLPEGCSVDVPAQFSNYVCTEFGIVNLSGLSGYERAAALISIAHPDDREMLRKVATEEGVLPPKSKINFLPVEGGNRRYPSLKDRQYYKLPHNSEVWGFDWDPYQNGK